MGMVSLGMVPDFEGQGEEEGTTYRFMGIYGPNRWEWTTTMIGNMMNSITSVPFYDTLGHDSVDFIFEHTELTSISCHEPNVHKLLKFKEDG